MDVVITKQNPYTKAETKKLKEQYVAISSMALDLKRASLGFARGSNAVGERFLSEALKRRSEINTSQIPNYLENILSLLEHTTWEHKKNSEDLLMYSTLLLNYLQKLPLSSK